MNIKAAISANIFKTWIIIILFVIFVTTLGYVVGKLNGGAVMYAGFALIIAGISSIGSYYYSDKLVLASTGARAVERDDNPALYQIIEKLAQADGIPTPKVYIVDDPSPNAFATGRDPQHAAVAVTTGILQRLNNTELEGVIAHELSHVKNFDTRLMAIVAILVGFVAILADMFMRSLWWGGSSRDNENDDNRSQAVFMILGIAFAVLSPLIATLIQLAISRKREFLADASGVLLTKYPEGLASALEKIAADPTPTLAASNATAHLFISNPYKGKSAASWFASLFNTHPPIEERIKILRSM